ncbi:MAG TPA: tetratricopeptide repeat protein, partial [Candidatus Dormibacteraeota bacterium]|nr:tetratricopeptide repeat protein [Candidatus Dormibacteraeota bacterium]
MHEMARRAVVIGACGALIFCVALGLRGGANARQAKEKSAGVKKAAGKANAAEAYRFNTLGVAHMNQQRPADAQKYFEQALVADPRFGVARLNLGVALLAQ